MPISVGLGGGFGGGGGGLHTRRPPDIFSGATLAAARTARNTYFTANLGDLAQFQGDQSLAIVLRVTGVADVFETYAAGQEGLAYDQTQWLDRTDAIDGPQGDQGRFELFIHTNSAGTPSPATPTGGTYVVGTGVFTPPTGTTEAPTNPGVGEDVYISQAVLDPLTDMGTVTPIWSLWIERAHVSSGITSVSSDGTLTGLGVSADPLSVVNPITAVNPTAAFTDRATSLQVGATVYELPDDVEDVTNVGLPALTVDNYRRIFIDHDTPQVWIGHREVISAVPAGGTFTELPIGPVYFGAWYNPPTVTSADRIYYSTQFGTWHRSFAIHLGGFGWFNEPASSALGTVLGFARPTWIGRLLDDATATGLIDNFSAGSNYFYYMSPSGGAGLGVRHLTNSTYTVAISRTVHFLAEPISTPSGVGTITGLTSGGGITLGGGTGTVSSGTVTLGIDPALGSFPTIPLDKGGTGATTDVLARTNLGLGTAAVLDGGDAAGDVPVLVTNGVLDPARLASSGQNSRVLTYQSGGTMAWLDSLGLTAVGHDSTLDGLGTSADPLEVVGKTAHLADSTVYSAGAIIDATVSSLPSSGDTDNGVLLSFEVPAGVPNDSTQISLRVNVNTSRGIFDHTERRIVGSDLQAVGHWITVQRILNEYYSLGTLGAAVGGVDSYATAVDVTFTSGEVGVSITGNHSFAAISDSANLGLGTAALLDTGVGDGNIPLLDSGGLLDDARIPAGIMRDSEFTAAFVAALTSAVTGNVETNIAVTVSGTGKLDFVSGSGITQVESDGSLAGLGIAGNVLGIAPEGVDESHLAIVGAPSSTQDEVLTWDYANTRMVWEPAAGGGLPGPQAAFDLNIYRAASSAPPTPTGGSYVIDTGVLTPPTDWLAAPVTPGAGEELYQSRYNVNPALESGTIVPTWSAPFLTSDGLTTVSHDTAFTGTGTSGSPLALAVAGADFPTITIAKGGTGAVTAAAARTALRGLTIGSAAGNISALGTGGVFDTARLAPSGSDGQVLSRTATGMDWEDSVAGYTDADVDARLVERLTTLPRRGTSFSDRFLFLDDSNPAILSATQGGDIRTYSTANWAQPGNATTAPSDKLAAGGAVGQVLTRTATAQAWEDATGMGGGLLTVASDGTLSGVGTSLDPLGVADDSITTLQLADLAVHTANLGLLSVHAAQLADDEITEPKLAASNAPGTNQVLGWDGSALQWVAQTGGGGLTVSAWDAGATYSHREYRHAKQPRVSVESEQQHGQRS